MAIELVAVGGYADTATANLNNTPIPAGTLENDLMILYVHGANRAGTDPANWAVPVDWTQRLEHGGLFPNNLGLEVFYKVATGSDTSPAIVLTGGLDTDGYAAFIATYRGVDPLDPWESSPATEDSKASSFSWATTGLTTTIDNSWVIIMVTQNFTNALSQDVANGFTLDAGGAAYDSDLGGTKRCAALSHKAMPTAGASGGPTYKRNGGLNVLWLGYYDTLKEGSPPPPPSSGPPPRPIGAMAGLGKMMNP